MTAGICIVCGAIARFGYRPPFVEKEVWFCGAHRLEGPVTQLDIPRRPPPPLGVCIVCDGAREWREKPCWCCVEKLPGPREAGWGGALPDAAPCAYCGVSVETELNQLIPVGVVDVGVRAAVHAWCWAAFRAREGGLADGPDARAHVESVQSEDSTEARDAS
jgi:hypothetical protein